MSVKIIEDMHAGVILQDKKKCKPKKDSSKKESNKDKNKDEE